MNNEDMQLDEPTVDDSTELAADAMPQDERLFARSLLAKLTTRERDVVRRRIVDDEPFDEIANDMGLSTERVEEIERGALEKMRKAA